MSTHCPSRRVTVVHVGEVDVLAKAFAGVKSLMPNLLPDALPSLVVIKPNLCDIVSWRNGVTTDPAWLGVLARELRAIRSDVEIQVVESDAISAYRAYRSCDETFERLGYVEAASASNVQLVNLSRSESLLVRFEGVQEPVRVPEIFLRELFFISIANLKVHPYERMSGILKNSLGLLTDANISDYHAYLPMLIAGIHRYAQPDLCIIDGRIGLEGTGPIIGVPVRAETLVAGRDALAVDLVACRIMGVRPRDVPHLRYTARTLGRNLRDVEIIGECRTGKFAFDPQRIHSAILMKFASRRFHRRMEIASSRWIDRLFRFKRDPLRFGAGLLRRFKGTSHGR